MTSESVVPPPTCRLLTGTWENEQTSIQDFSCQDVGPTASITSFNITVENARPPGSHESRE